MEINPPITSHRYPSRLSSHSDLFVLGLICSDHCPEGETPNDWFAWIPIANMFLLLAVAKKPLWWFFLLLIPFVNVVIVILIWMGIAETLGKPSWWGILTLIPLVGFIVPCYLAFSD
jgi:hypothetical protein